jgi:hypothetical protein
LLKTAAETLITIAADPKHLGARIGLTAVLHTWGSALTHHPHAHIIVPAGGFSPDGQHWIACRPGFFLTVRVLSRLFPRLFLERLTATYHAGRLQFFADQAALAEPAAFKGWLAALRKLEWVVYAKRPFGGPDAVLAYLSRYTHRIAIANSRLIAFDGERVTFKWKAVWPQPRRPAPAWPHRFTSPCWPRRWRLPEKIEEGLAALDDALAKVAVSGEKGWGAEIHRLRGELTARLPHPDRAKSEDSDYRAKADARYKLMTLDADEFIRRFLISPPELPIARSRTAGNWDMPTPFATPFVTPAGPRSVLGAPAVGEETVVSDAVEPVGQDVDQDSRDARAPSTRACRDSAQLPSARHSDASRRGPDRGVRS